jgi:hypothetical protein
MCFLSWLFNDAVSVYDRIIIEQSVERELAGETEVPGENLPKCHFVHHKSHMTQPRIEPGPTLWEAGD